MAPTIQVCPSCEKRDQDVFLVCCNDIDCVGRTADRPGGTMECTDCGTEIECGGCSAILHLCSKCVKNTNSIEDVKEALIVVNCPICHTEVCPECDSACEGCPSVFFCHDCTSLCTEGCGAMWCDECLPDHDCGHVQEQLSPAALSLIFNLIKDKSSGSFRNENVRSQ